MSLLGNGEATITVVLHQRDSVLAPWKSRVLTTIVKEDVYEEQFTSDTVSLMKDDHGQVLVMVESHAEFYEYADEP